MAKSKTTNQHSVQFAKGGSTKMHGAQSAGTQKSGQTGKGNEGGGDGKFAKGGSGKMHGFHAADAQKPGITSVR